MLQDEGKKMECCLSTKGATICSLAYSRLSSVLDNLFNGKLTIAELKTLCEKKDQVNNMFSYISPENNFEQLHQREIELTTFENFKKLLTPLCRSLESGNLEIKGDHVEQSIMGKIRVQVCIK